MRAKTSTLSEQTRRLRAAAFHFDDEILLVVRLVRKGDLNIADFFMKLQSLFED